MQRLDAMVVREKDGKSFWTKIGAAFEGTNGKWIVRLDANPIDGVIHLVKPLPPRDRQAPAASDDDEPVATRGDTPF